MSNKKPIVDKGIILYKDYEYLFNFLSDDETGKVIKLLLNIDFTVIPTLNPTDNDKINNVYNYIVNRIIDYQNKKQEYIKTGSRGGNPALKTLKGTVNPTDKLKEKKIKENKIIYVDKKNLIMEKIKNFNYNTNNLNDEVDRFFGILKDFNDEFITKVFDNLKLKADKKDGKCYLPCMVIAEEAAKELSEKENSEKMNKLYENFKLKKLSEGIEEEATKSCGENLVTYNPIREMWNKLTDDEKLNYCSNFNKIKN